mgnify:CR=1 FL=1
MNQKISISEKIGYSLGDCSANLVFQMMMIYQTKFYTDVFGLEGAIAGSVMLIARIVDAFVDPTVGILSDKTQTRWGKYRPWILWTALPFMVFYVLAFYNPGIEDKSLVAVYATISYTLLMTLYSFNNTPYASLGGVMTSDIKERNSITSIRFVAATVAQFVVQGLTLPLVGKFAGADGDKGHGWLCTISLFAVIGFVFFIITFFSARERITPPASQKTDTRKDIKDVFRNIPWRAMFILTLFLFTTLAMWGSAMNYYFENYVDANALYTFLDKLGLVSRRSECKFKLQYTECFRIDSQWSGESLRSGLWSFQHGRCTGTILRSNPVIQFSRQPLWKEARVYHLPDADSHLHCAVLFPQ